MEASSAEANSRQEIPETRGNWSVHCRLLLSGMSRHCRAGWGAPFRGVGHEGDSITDLRFLTTPSAPCGAATPPSKGGESGTLDRSRLFRRSGYRSATTADGPL